MILVPVLRRPHRVEPLLLSIAEATPEPHRVLFVVEEGDAAERAAIDAAGADCVLVRSNRRSYARKINDGYRGSTEPLVFMGADDLAPHPGWLTAATTLLRGDVQVVGTNDLGNPRVIAGEHSTHTLVTRAYADTVGGVIDGGPGSLLNERYPHSWVDDEFVATARYRGVYAHAHDSRVEHLHWLWGKGMTDATYRLGATGHATGRRIFRSRAHLWAA